MDQGQAYVPVPFYSRCWCTNPYPNSGEWGKHPLVSAINSDTLRNIKDVSSSNTIRRLSADPRAHKIPHIYYFFNFRDVSTQTCENSLRSILCQLLYSLPDVPDAIAELYERHNLGTLRPSARDMIDCIIALVNELDEVRLFGDAFDECTDWNNLWYLLSTTVKSRCPGFRFLFTGRPEVHILEAVNSLDIPSVDLDCEGINKDIEVFVSDSLAKDIRFARTLEEGKALIRHSLISRANGMYAPLIAPFW